MKQDSFLIALVGPKDFNCEPLIGRTRLAATRR